MAAFKSHLYGAAATSGLAALGVYSLGWTGAGLTQILFLVGIAGGLLPDIDAPRSTPVRGFFTLTGAALAFAMAFNYAGRLPLIGLGLIWLLVFLTVRYGIFTLFVRYTLHRGIWHSWLAALAVSLAAAVLAHHAAGLGSWESWLAGLFALLGYLTHLILDEIASVDLQGRRLKRSLGSALKPWSQEHPRASLGMLLAVLALGSAAPSLAPVLAVANHYGWDLAALQTLQALRWPR